MQIYGDRKAHYWLAEVGVGGDLEGVTANGHQLSFRVLKNILQLIIMVIAQLHDILKLLFIH